MWYWHDGGFWWFGFGWMILFMILFWGAIIALIVWAIRRLTGPRHPGAGESGRADALDIARERYAKGEISREEFERIKKDLSS